MQPRKRIFFVSTVLVAISLTALNVADAGIVKDSLGRTVHLPPDPQRIVAFAPSITEIIFALEQQQRLKGVTIYSNYPEAAKSLPRVGSYVRLDLERIVALNPDLCIATKDGNPKALIERLESMNIPVFVVDPRNLESVMKTICDLGAILHATDRANALVGNMQMRVQRIKSLIARSNDKPRVFFQIGITPIVSVGTDTFIHELIINAGGINLAEGKDSYPRFSREQVLGLKPDVFIISSMARGVAFDNVRKEWFKWPHLPAVRNNRIYLVDSDLFNRPTPRLVDSLEMLAGLIHPEIFEEIR
jgi:iron complex transport system substrate-binding protein